MANMQYPVLSAIWYNDPLVTTHPLVTGFIYPRVCFQASRKSRGNQRLCVLLSNRSGWYHHLWSLRNLWDWCHYTLHTWSLSDDKTSHPRKHVPTLQQVPHYLIHHHLLPPPPPARDNHWPITSLCYLHCALPSPWLNNSVEIRVDYWATIVLNEASSLCGVERLLWHLQCHLLLLVLVLWHLPNP